MKTKNNNAGLKQRLQKATTVAEVETLLAKGRTYDEASDKTRRQWSRIAKHISEMCRAEEGKKPSKKEGK